MAKQVTVENKPNGRPTDYRPEFAREAKKLCQLGATNADLADFFEVSIPTIWAWSCRFPEFFSAQKIGKDVPDDIAERSLFSRVKGYTFDAEEIYMVEGVPTPVMVRKHIPPDVTACIYWTKNRRPDQWRDRRSEDEGQVGGVTISGGFSGTITVRPASGGETPNPAPEPEGSLPGVSEES